MNKHLILAFIILSCSFSSSQTNHNTTYEFEEKNIKIGIQRLHLTFNFFKNSQYEMGRVEFGDFHHSRNHIEYIMPFYMLVLNTEESSFLAIRTYNSNEIANYEYNGFLNKKLEYKGYTIYMGGPSSRLKNSLQLIKKFKVNNEDIWIEFFLKNLPDRYITKENGLLEFADYFINSKLENNKN